MPMRLSPLSTLLLALVLAASLPLRGFAAPAACAPVSQAPAAREQVAHRQAHCEHPQAHCHHGSMAGHGTVCDCCCAAIATAAPGWAVPHEPPDAASARSVRHSPFLTSNRLDRPPRRPA